jgi:hypothetical protein
MAITFFDRSYAAPRWVFFSSALFISIFLAIAAYGKFFYPAPQLQLLDRLTSLFEVGMIACLLTMHRRMWTWVGAAAVFASWGGYAIYWCCLKMPCSCIGSMVALPSLYALVLDIVFFGLSAALAFLLGLGKSALYLIVVCAFLFALFGYAFAEWVFFVKVVGVKWRFL